MTIKDLILAIKEKHSQSGIVIHPPTNAKTIANFEQKAGFELPPDFKEFYLICNGLECTEDIFNIIPLEEIHLYGGHFGPKWFHFAEYMIYCDMWSLRKSEAGTYEIFNSSEKDITLTSSLHEFLMRFYRGNVFEEGGLYDWIEEYRSKDE